MDPIAERIDDADLRWSTGAPMPVLFASEHTTCFAFDHIDDGARLCRFTRCTSVRFGFPGDVVQQGLSLWNAGLRYYGAYAIRESPWLDELRTIERVHPQSPPTPFADSLHFVLLFHDSTLEAVATGVEVLGRHDNLPSALAEMAKRIAADV